MTADIIPIGSAAGETGNTGNSGNTSSPDPISSEPRQTVRSPLAEPGDETDHGLTDLARDVAVDVLETTQAEHGETHAATEAAVRVLLLAAAELRWDITIAGRGLLFSEMLLADLDELRDGLVAPPTGANAKGDRLAAAARAGWAPDPLTASSLPKSVTADQSRGIDEAQDGPPVLRMPTRVGVELARGWLAACKPGSTNRDDDAPPPMAA